MIAPGRDAAGGADAAVAVVLDTHVALDWLLFDDSRARSIAERVVAGRWVWLASPAMRAEFAEVVRRPALASRGHTAERALTSFDRWACPTEAPAAGGLAARSLRSRDPDDQMFVDLALARGARWLFTRDKALLELAGAAARHGVAIVAPEHWAAAADGG